MEDKKSEEKKIKNLISLSILLAGLFVGSLFVDVVQLMGGGGFSQRILNKSDVFNVDGRTWVAYEEPVINVQVLTDDECEACQPDEAIIGLKRELPTILTEKVDVKSEKGKKIMEDFNIKAIPAFIFSQNIEETPLFAQAAAVFEQKDDKYLLNSTAVGLPVGKFTTTPDINENDIAVGPEDAKVKVVQFSDFQCPYCKQMHEAVVGKMLAEYGDRIQFVYKHLPLDFHAQAQNAALASECANEQDKFISYADKLFAEQDSWGETQGTQVFKGYASQLGLNSSQFNQCVDSRKYEQKINEDVQEAQEFGISGTPANFVNDQFIGGLTSYDSFKGTIEGELAE